MVFQISLLGHVVFHSCQSYENLPSTICTFSTLCECYILFSIYLFFLLNVNVNNWKYQRAHGLRRLRCIFDGPEDSVRHGWYIFEWHFISAIWLILMRFLSFIGVCACISLCGCLQCLRLSGKRAPIKQFVSDSEGLQPRGGGTSADLGLLTGLRKLMTLARLSILNLFQVIHLSQGVFEEYYSNMIINNEWYATILTDL